MKLATTLFASALLAATTCSALTIDVTSVAGFATNVPIANASGYAIPAGNRILVGTFDTSSSGTPALFFAKNSTDIPTLMSHFTGVSSKQTMIGKSDRDGTFGVTAGADTPAADGCFTMSVGLSIAGTSLVGKQVYVVVFKTSDNSTNLGPNYWNVSEYAVFSSTNSGWVFKDDSTDLSAKITLRTNEIDLFYISTGNALKTFALGAETAGALWSTQSAQASGKSKSWYGDVWPIQYGNGWFVSGANACWQYAVAGGDGVWIYDFTVGWTWTDELYYPYVYLYDSGEWAYYYGIIGGKRWYCVFDSALSAHLPNYPYATDAQLGAL